MPVSIEFSTANAAFASNGYAEAYRILLQIAERVGGCDDSGTIRDTNGNTIGQWSATIDAEESE